MSTEPTKMGRWECGETQVYCFWILMLLSPLVDSCSQHQAELKRAAFFCLLITSSKQYVFAFIDVCASIKLHWLIALIVTQAVCVCVCGPLALVILWSSVWVFMFCNFSYQSQWSLIRPAASKLFLTHEGKSITQLQGTLFVFISCEWHLLKLDSEAALLIASALLSVMMPLRSSPLFPLFHMCI